MKHTILDSWKSLLRFLTWYGLAVAAILYLLPWAGQWVEQHYDALSSTARLISVIGFFIAVGAWQVLQMRRRSRQLRPNRGYRQPDLS
jgi:hypothetical protein